HVRRTHYPRAVDRHIYEDAVEIDVLLRMRVDQVVIMVAGNREHRLPIHLGIIETVEEVNAPRAGGGQAAAELPGELGVAARGKACRFLMAHLDEADLLLPLPQRLHYAVNPVSRNPEDDLDSPVVDSVDKNVRGSNIHAISPSFRYGHCRIQLYPS